MDANEERAAKSERPLVKMPGLAIIEAALSNAGFLAFARILGIRITSGKTESAFHMLTGLGCVPKLAHDIIEGWGTERLSDLLRPEEEDAVRFSKFIDDLGAYDWPELLAQSVILAAAKEKEE